jgi:predicted ribosomally synthesized peptide with SipW-like signal peptide
MNKILLSLLTIIATASLVLGVSNAFFTDAETSTNNSFTTGAIDLKVDSVGHYNGLECLNGLWQKCAYTGSGPELVVNGGFETPVVTTAQKWDIFPNGTSGLSWTVEWVGDESSYGGIDRPEPSLQELHRGVNGWLPAVGEQYTELDTDWDGPNGSVNNEPALVRISQEITTTIGAKYHLSYQFSPRPGTNSADNQLKVYLGGNLVGNHSANGSSQNNWTKHTYQFEANSTTTKLEFVGGGASNSLGIFLDDVSLTEQLRECIPSEEITESCSSSWDLADIGLENKFFHFTDLKPGDSGENTISLQVTNNDSYVCLYTTNFTNLEAEQPSEAEISTGDPNTNVGEPGELDKYLEFMAWRDDGDNVWEAGETLITGESPVGADSFLTWQYPLFSPTSQALVKGETNYLGVAWCFGSLNLDSENHSWTCDGSGNIYNDAQTDSVSADIGFYAEQVRNNQAFTCEKVP